MEVQMVSKTIGDRIKEAREAKHMTQAEVAKYLGIKREAYSNIENGYSEVRARYLVVLSRVLGEPVSYFLGLVADADEEKILMLYRNLPDAAKHMVLIYLEALRMDYIREPEDPVYTELVKISKAMTPNERVAALEFLQRELNPNNSSGREIPAVASTP
jgi:transcriptional regulator with XRE-family HTH domain